jgi:hypothetical protein
MAAELKPCSKFRRVNAIRFVRHVNETKAKYAEHFLFARQFAARFEHLAPDADGNIDPLDKKRITKFLRAVERLEKDLNKGGK